MRHLGGEGSAPKNEYLEEFFQIKEENIYDLVNTYDSNFKLELNESEEDVWEKERKPRNRRKLLVPQKAVIGSSHALPDLAQDSSEIDKMLSSELNGEDLLQDINEEDIFKDLQEEAEGEKLDGEMLDNVKEEWKAHWGVKCNMCEQVFPHKVEFDKHYQDNYGLVPVYTCTFCNKTAEKYSTFRSHCYRHITEGRYKCQECSKGFSLQSMLHVHILAKHTKSKPFACDECGRTFVTKPGLKTHLKKHKTEQREDYPCAECGKILHTRGGLTSHMNVHRLGRRFMCDVCGKTFTQKVNMQQHVKQHTGDKPHGCEKCGKTFAEKSHLARHYSFHSEERPFKCDVCQKMYKTERCLKVHSLVHATERPFVCSYCSKGFLSSTKLKQHYNIHTGERPYKCKFCERTFTNYPNLLKHTRRKHKMEKSGENPIKEEIKNETTTDDALSSDLNFNKNEEFLQGLINFPIIDEKFVIPPTIELGPSGALPPFFPPTSPNIINAQFGDLIHSQYLQQPLM